MITSFRIRSRSASTLAGTGRKSGRFPHRYSTSRVWSPLHCDIHQHMQALILVLDTPYFTKTESEGRYKLSGLPAGQYTLKAWTSSKTTLEKPVELKNGSTV